MGQVMTIQTIPKRFKFARRATLLFFVLCILLLVYTFYRSEVIYLGQWHEKYLKYYLFSLTGMVFWGVALKLKDEIKLNIIMATISMILGVYLIEVILGFKFSFYGVDRRTVYEVYRDLRKEKVDAVPAVFPALFLKSNGLRDSDPLFPLGGVSRKTTVFCNESGKYIIYLSDRFGFNNPDSVWDSLKLDSILVGDSFTHGACVESGEDITSQIRLNTGENALNLGMSGNGPLATLGVLKEYAKFKAPKNVLWLYFEGNDMLDLQQEKPNSLLMSYLQPEFFQNLIQQQKEIDRRLEKYIKAQIKKNLSMLPRLQKQKLLDMTRIFRLFHIRTRFGLDKKNKVVQVNVDPLFTEILRQAKAITHSWGGNLYFVYLPDRGRYEQHQNDHETYYNRRRVIDVASSLDIPVVDIYEDVFKNHPDPISLFSYNIRLYYSPHYNSTGYSEVAKAIISRVRKLTMEGNTLSRQLKVDRMG